MAVRGGWDYTIQRTPVSVDKKVTQILYVATISPVDADRVALNTTKIPWAIVVHGTTKTEVGHTMARLTSDSREKLMRDIQLLIPRKGSHV